MKICLYKNLELKSKNNELNEKNTDNLFQEFDKSVKSNESLNFDKFSINDIINEAIEKAINGIVIKIINTKAVLTSSKNVSEIAIIFEKFFKDSNFGIFTHTQKSGRNNFKVIHKSGSNGSKFLEKFFEKIFKACLENYSYHIISDENSLCVIFR